MALQSSFIDTKREPLHILSEAVYGYQPYKIFGLFSGGHDSLCACHVASAIPEFDGCVHINTGIGVEETREFVRQTCKDFAWPLIELHPPVPYSEIVREHGFPGPGQHFSMYVRLKERCIAQLMRDHKDPQNRRRKVMLVSGARVAESTRRMGNAVYIREGPSPSKRALWVNPILDWTAKDKKTYMARFKLPRNPVVERLCMSGECLCGAFAEPGELDVIRGFYPAAAKKIDTIAAEVKANGKHCIWGTRPPGTKGHQPAEDQMELPLCHSCGAKYTNSGRIVITNYERLH